MLRALLVTLTMLLGAKIASAQELDAPGIEATITGQMEAFRAEDAAAAFAFASPMIQSMFGSSDRFGTMVQQGYPMVWNNAEIFFLDLEEVNGATIQIVRIRDEAGGLHVLAYNMVEMGGSWLINGVQYIEAPDVAA